MLLVAAYAAADRLWGSDVPHGRRWAIGLTLLAGYLLDGFAGAALAAAFCAVRSLPFKAYGGSSTPTTDRERIGLFARHAMVIPPAVMIALVSHGDLLKPIIAFGAYAAFATALGSYYGKENARAKERGESIDPNMNQAIEIVRGAAFGLAAWLV